MSSKKWLVTFFFTVLLLVLSFAGLNFLVDPFGVFGDRIYNWYAYNETMNPRAAKIAYLDRHHEAYDSYIIGCSSTSSFPVADLNRYYNAKFYNMIMYGADMKDVEETVAYLIGHYTVKNLIVNVYINNGAVYDVGEDKVTSKLHAKVSGKSKLAFYGQYLFLNPQYALKKIEAHRADSYLPQVFDVFDAETGAYDKRGRDAEPIGDLAEYLQDYPVFVQYPFESIPMTATDRCLESVAVIRDLCEAAGIGLTFVCAPVYSDYLSCYDRDEVADFYTKLAEITPYWDFSISSVSYEPRYFYDGTHFRNAVGAMALARIFGDTATYVPADFGVYVTAENVAAHLESFWRPPAIDAADCCTDLPILIYHEIAAPGNDTTVISPATFAAQMKALADKGYTAISPEQLISYVRKGTPLPEKPVLLTFDDGYLSNYEIAYPILKDYNMKAAMFLIGVSVGKDTYLDTDIPIFPHFTYEAAREMAASGLITIGSHTYDMHRHAPNEKGRARESVLRFEGEDEGAYIAALTADYLKSKEEIEAATGQTVASLAYPRGAYDLLSQAILTGLGVEATFSTETGNATIVKGLPQSLIAMKRWNVNEGVSAAALLEMIAGQ